MARTVNVEERTVRRDAFVDAATKRIQTQGYERMSVQDVLDDVDASRGAFYHYFDSKQALLEAVIDRMGDAAIAGLGDTMDDPGLAAPQKLEIVFASIGSYKAERFDLVMAILEAWLSDDNAIVREKFRRYVVIRMTPLLATIIGQGAREGVDVRGRPRGHGADRGVAHPRRQRARRAPVHGPPGRHGLDGVDRGHLQRVSRPPSSGSSALRRPLSTSSTNRPCAGGSISP